MPVKCLPYCYKFSIFSHHIDNIQLYYELWFSFHDLRAMFVFICVIWTESERTNRSEMKKKRVNKKGYAVVEYVFEYTHEDTHKQKKEIIT